jgi:hypothetical protein
MVEPWRPPSPSRGVRDGSALTTFTALGRQVPGPACDSCDALEDVSELGSWTGLRHLDLRFCPSLTALGFSLGQLSKLETLWLDDISVLTDEDLLATKLRR